MSQEEKIQKYKTMLLKWNERINLIGKSTEAELQNRHIEDSLQIIDTLKQNLKANEQNTIIDFGSGAGLPAIIVAICLSEDTNFANTKIIMCESNSKKTAFLTNVIAELGLKNTLVKNIRIEEIKDIKANIITGRAFAELSLIFELSKNFLIYNNGICETKFVLHKGENLEKELFEASKKWEYNHTEFNSKTGAGKILIVENLISKK